MGFASLLPEKAIAGSAAETRISPTRRRAHPQQVQCEVHVSFHNSYWKLKQVCRGGDAASFFECLQPSPCGVPQHKALFHAKTAKDAKGRKEFVPGDQTFDFLGFTFICGRDHLIQGHNTN